MQKVKFYHLRLIRYGEPDYKKNKYYATGGATFAYTYNPELKSLVFAMAKCNDKDNYNKKIGRQIAKARLENNKAALFTTNNIEKDKVISIMKQYYIESEKDYWPDVQYFIE